MEKTHGESLTEVDSTRDARGPEIQETEILLKDADEALGFLSKHPQAEAISQAGQAILEDPQRLKMLVRKIDLALIPLVGCIYFLQYLDKTTLTYASVMGIREDSHLVGNQYSELALLFYVGYLVAEFPTQYLAQRSSRLGLYLGINIILWGIVLAAHAACSSFTGLAICRALLGVFESCVIPILVLIIAMWYKKEEQGRRISWFYVCNCFAQIIGGLMAYGVSFKHGSFASWRVLYVVIGALTMVLGAVVCLFLPDSPVRAKRFSDEEKVAILLRVRENYSGTQNARLKKQQVFECFKDLRIYLVCLIVMLASVPNGALTAYAGILLTSFGYTPSQSLALLSPVGAVGVIFVILIGYLSDRWKDRSLTMIICIIPTLLAAGLFYGFDPDGTPKNKAGLLAAAMLVGSFGVSFMVMLAWNASNIAGHSKKVTAGALTLVSFCVGNILGAITFQSSEAPGYRSGKISIVSTLSALVVVVIILRLYNDYLNRQNRRALEAMTQEEKELLRRESEWRDWTDRENRFFVYTH